MSSPHPTAASPSTAGATNPRTRSAFLAEAGRLLAESLDYESILQQVADAAVPTFADWCAVDVVHSQRDGGWPPAVRRVAVAGRDPNKLTWARKLGVEMPIAQEVYYALFEGKSVQRCLIDLLSRESKDELGGLG